ncbi:MAG TPA: VWA domain-containing protein, partial [Terriglobia bacterium]|nr:VWA domain-containing protein [Terriglobia bacterium]
MKFLALSPSAAILLAVLTTIALVAMYFLKLRHRRMMIASSMLWNKVLARHEERSLLEKLRRILSVIFAVIIGLLMVFAVARPEIDGLSGSTGRTMIVLDSSPSMSARMSDGKTRWQHAMDIADTIVDSSGSGSEFRIADTSGQYDSPYIGGKDEAKKAIRTLRPIAATPQFPESDDATAQTYFISDGVSIPAVPPTARKVITYDTARNFGITAFEVRSMVSAPLQYEAYLEVT